MPNELRSLGNFFPDEVCNKPYYLLQSHPVKASNNRHPEVHEEHDEQNIPAIQ